MEKKRGENDWMGRDAEFAAQAVCALLGAFDVSSGAAAITGAAVVKSKIAWSVEAPPSPESTNLAMDVMEQNELRT